MRYRARNNQHERHAHEQPAEPRHVPRAEPHASKETAPNAGAEIELHLSAPIPHRNRARNGMSRRRVESPSRVECSPAPQSPHPSGDRTLALTSARVLLFVSRAQKRTVSARPAALTRRARTCHNAPARARHDRHNSYQKTERLAARLPGPPRRVRKVAATPATKFLRSRGHPPK
jgi:hypothetical protein